MSGRPNYGTLRGATVVVPPAKTARVSRRRPRSSARDRTINKAKRIGGRRWKKTSRYHQPGPRRERVLQVQVDHRRWSSSQDTRWANGRSAARVQHTECDDRPGPARLLRHRPVKYRWLGSWRPVSIRAPTPESTNGLFQAWRNNRAPTPGNGVMEPSAGTHHTRKSIANTRMQKSL